MNLPSVKKLATIPKLEPGFAKRIRAWIEYAEGLRLENVQNAGGDYTLRHVRPEAVTPNVESWIRSCYCRPTQREVAHAMIASILGGEWDVFEPQEEWNSIKEGPAWEAVNLGDPYITTLIYRRGRYSVGAWGDMPELGA